MKKKDVIQKLKEALFMDEELGSAYDEMCLEKEGKLFIDGLVYEILHGYHGWDDLYEKIDAIVTEWAKSLGGDYYDWDTASILIPAS